MGLGQQCWPDIFWDLKRTLENKALNVHDKQNGNYINRIRKPMMIGSQQDKTSISYMIMTKIRNTLKMMPQFQWILILWTNSKDLLHNFGGLSFQEFFGDPKRLLCLLLFRASTLVFTFQ